MTTLIEVKNLVKDFPIKSVGFKKKDMRALNDVSLTIKAGKSLAVVGESGSGKSTIARIITGIYSPSQGDICYQGDSVVGITDKKSQMSFRQNVQMVFQDPFSSLNPTHTIGYHIERALKLHQGLKKKKDIYEKSIELLTRVGLTPAAQTIEKFPYELSGGQRQRVNIARVLAVGAKVVLADEPTSMLDVSIRIGVLNLMNEMKEKEGIGFMYITHDIATARYFSEETAVMYVGHMVEWGDTEKITQNPAHPYTKLLISAVPDPLKSIHDPLDGGERGEIPSWNKESKGCPFAKRCTKVMDKCHNEMPEITQLSEDHFGRCFLFDQ